MTKHKGSQKAGAAAGKEGKKKKKNKQKRKAKKKEAKRAKKASKKAFASRPRRMFKALREDMALPKPGFDSAAPTSGGRFRVVGCDYIRAIKGTEDWTTAMSLMVNPYNRVLFKELPSLAKPWKKYRFHKVEFHYYGRTAADKTGEIAHYFEPDPASTPFRVEDDVLNNERSTSGSAWSTYDCMAGFPDKEWKFLRVAGTDAADIRMQNSGIYNLYTKGMADDTSEVGRLYVTYDVEFMDRAPGEALANSSQIYEEEELKSAPGGLETESKEYYYETLNIGFDTDSQLEGGLPGGAPGVDGPPLPAGTNDWGRLLAAGGTYLLNWYFDVEDTKAADLPVRIKKPLKVVACESDSRKHRRALRSSSDTEQKMPTVLTEGFIAVLRLYDAYTGDPLIPVGNIPSDNIIASVAYDMTSATRITDTISVQCVVPPGRVGVIKKSFSNWAADSASRYLHDAVFEISIDNVSGTPPVNPPNPELTKALEKLRSQILDLERKMSTMMDVDSPIISIGGKGVVLTEPSALIRSRR